jgi:hypothetical protein
MGPKIAEKRVTDAPQALGPSFETGNVVHADTQYLGIIALELV